MNRPTFAAAGIGALGVLIGALALAGCEALARRDAAREVAEARVDHAACLREGVAFPAPAYTDCRRRQADARNRQRWTELSLAQQQNAVNTPEVAMVDRTPGVFRAIDPARFACAKQGEGVDEVILCRER